ncbi:MAG: DUF3237 family protein [Leptolyngbya sp.]|nr:DUF3237 family protein [Candidatus Melainabacteria bacterium]
MAKVSTGYMSILVGRKSETVRGNDNAYFRQTSCHCQRHHTSNRCALFTLRVSCGSLRESGVGPYRIRQYYEITGGEVHGQRLKGKLVGTGSDWMLAGQYLLSFSPPNAESHISYVSGVCRGHFLSQTTF